MMGILRAVALSGLVGFTAIPAASQVCVATNEDLRAWHNPHPARSDFVLPLPLGLSLVFAPVPLGTKGLYGDEKSTYEMGSSDKRMFETTLLVRVGSSISDQNGQAMLLVGKYELTKAQYAAVMGAGDLRQGLKVLSERSKEERTQKVLYSFLDPSEPCHRKITLELHRLLSEPVTFLSYRDYVEFLDTFNLQCIRRPDCRKRLIGLGPNDEVTGFIRLPYEHEWEFVARGGGDYVGGLIGRTALQADLPPIPAGKRITAYAHVGNDPPRVLPIGSRDPLFGLYDIYGNAQELMGNSFTAENGYGAVGGYVARGGHYRLSDDELRASRRIELRVFRLDEKTGEPQIQYFPRTGIRLVIGYPVEGAADSLTALRVQEEGRIAPDKTGDNAGNSLAEARDLGDVRDQPIALSEELDRNDNEDWYRVRLLEYGKLALRAKGTGFLLFELRSPTEWLSRTIGAGSMQTELLIPGEYFVRVSSPTRLSREQTYEVTISRKVAADTGDRFETSSLSGAHMLIRTRSFQREGFVGRADPIDSYAVRNLSGIAGLEIVLTAAVPLTLRYADERLNTVAEIRAGDVEMPATLPVPVPVGSVGFVQVEAEGTAQAKYTLSVRPRLPFDELFSITYLERPGKTAVPGREYEANISGLQTLYLPIRVDTPRRVRLELSNLTADVDMTVIGPRRRVVGSNHQRDGTRGEFFFEILESGVYNVSVKNKDQRAHSTLTLSYHSEQAPESLSLQQHLETVRLSARQLGIFTQNTNNVQIDVSSGIVYWKFRVTGQSQYVSLVLENFSAAADLDLYLENSAGLVLGKSANAGAETERIGKLVGPGTYYVRVVLTGSSKSSNAILRARSWTALKEPDLDWAGELVEQWYDWKVYWNNEDDKCIGITMARDVTPEFGWREFRPFFIVQVTGESKVGIAMDMNFGTGGTDLYQPGTVKASVKGSGTIPTSFENSALQPIDEEGYVADSAISAFTNGQELIITGTAPDGADARFVYSLRGYIRAMQRINQVCDADANWLWNR